MTVAGRRGTGSDRLAEGANGPVVRATAAPMQPSRKSAPDGIPQYPLPSWRPGKFPDAVPSSSTSRQASVFNEGQNIAEINH